MTIPKLGSGSKEIKGNSIFHYLFFNEDKITSVVLCENEFSIEDAKNQLKDDATKFNCAVEDHTLYVWTIRSTQ